jgi:hypothetical protein
MSKTRVSARLQQSQAPVAPKPILALRSLSNETQERSPHNSDPWASQRTLGDGEHAPHRSFGTPSAYWRGDWWSTADTSRAAQPKVAHRFADTRVVQSSAPRVPAMVIQRLVDSSGVKKTRRLVSSDQCVEQNTDRPHEIDGCSGGVAQDPTNYGGVYIPYITGRQRYNGEGSTAFGKPQDDVPHSKLSSVLPLPCNKHDICYQTCGSSQKTCDNQMLKDMLSVCNSVYPENCPSKFKQANKCDDYFKERKLCTKSANRMYKGLSAFGSSAFKKRQKQYCRPCKKKQTGIPSAPGKPGSIGKGEADKPIKSR